MSEENFFVNKFLYFQEKNQNDYFYNSLIYIFEHNQQGALGIVMNKVIPISENIIFKSLKINADIERKNNFIELTNSPAEKLIYQGHSVKNFLYKVFFT